MLQICLAYPALSLSSHVSQQVLWFSLVWPDPHPVLALLHASRYCSLVQPGQPPDPAHRCVAGAAVLPGLTPSQLWLSYSTAGAVTSKGVPKVTLPCLLAVLYHTWQLVLQPRVTWPNPVLILASQCCDLVLSGLPSSLGSYMLQLTM